MGFTWPTLFLLSFVVMEVLTADNHQQDKFPTPNFLRGFRPISHFPSGNNQDSRAETASETAQQSHTSFTDEDSIPRREKDNTKDGHLQTFDGFPEDFKQGLQPFSFGNSNKQQQSASADKFPSHFPMFSSLSGFGGSLFPPTSPPGTIMQQSFRNTDVNDHKAIRSSRAKQPTREDEVHNDSSETFSNFPQNSQESKTQSDDSRETSNQQTRNNGFDTISPSSHEGAPRPSQRFPHSGGFQGFPSQKGHDNSNQPQNFIPIAHFQPMGPFQFGPFQQFRPESQGTHFPPPRPFRQINQPLFFAPPSLNFEGNRENFHLPRRPQQLPQQRPQVHHNLEEQEDQPERDRPREQFHEDNTKKHQSSTTDNILGSGNFGIIRGGIFADDDNPSPSFRPFQHDYQSEGHNGPDDFFNGFHDFQPFPGPLNNALTSLTGHNVESTSSAAKALKPSKGAVARPRKV